MKMTSIHKCTYVNVAEKPLEGNIYSNDYYAKNKYQTKLHPQKHEKKKKNNLKRNKTEQSKQSTKLQMSSRKHNFFVSFYYIVFSYWLRAMY